MKHNLFRSLSISPALKACLENLASRSVWTHPFFPNSIFLSSSTLVEFRLMSGSHFFSFFLFFLYKRQADWERSLQATPAHLFALQGRYFSRAASLTLPMAPSTVTSLYTATFDGSRTSFIRCKTDKRFICYFHAQAMLRPVLEYSF